MGKTLIEKIIGANCKREVRPGDIVTVKADYVMLDDIMMPFIVSKFREMGFSKVWDPSRAVIICDHLVPASQVDDTRAYHISCDFAAEQGCTLLARREDVREHELLTAFLCQCGYAKLLTANEVAALGGSADSDCVLLRTKFLMWVSERAAGKAV